MVLMSMKPKTLVTGADGFIGSHLVEALVQAGHSVRAFVMYNSFSSWGWLNHVVPEVLKEIEVFAGDVRDPHRVRTAVRGCDNVLHLAALIAIPYSYESPEAYLDTNARGTLNVLQAARDLGARRVICTSTSEVYGTARFVPMTEDHPLQAQSPYAASKIAADMMALSFHAAYGTPVTVLRPFNTYGPRQSARAVIPAIISQIAAGNRRIKLGALYPTRDFTFVRDTANGFVHAMGCDSIVGQVTNIGSGFEISIGDTARVIAEAMGAEIEIECDQDRLRPAASEVGRLYAATAKAQRALSWNPEFGGINGFRRGLAETAEWFRDPANLAYYKTDRYDV
jgi:NAD dependent epimerase/dehydratase